MAFNTIIGMNIKSFKSVLDSTFCVISFTKWYSDVSNSNQYNKLTMCRRRIDWGPLLQDYN